MISQYYMVFNWCAIIISHYSTNQVSILIRLPKYMLGMIFPQILLIRESQLLRQTPWNHWCNLWSTTTTMTSMASWFEGEISGFCIKFVLLIVCSLNHKMWTAVSSSSPALQLLLMLSKLVPMKPVLLQISKHLVTSVLLWQAQSLCPTRLVCCAVQIYKNKKH